MHRRNVILSGLAAFGLGGWYLTSGRTNAPANLNALIAPANAQTTESEAEVDISTIQEMVLGDPDAPVEMIEYASYTCPHCARFHNDTFKQLKADYIDSGKVRFIYREVYFDRFGLWASLLARCGGADKFFGITDLIYSGQDSWARAGEPAAIVEELRKIGRLAGLDNETIEACLQDGDKARTLVAWYQENAESDGIDSTPSFVINGTKYQNVAYAEMQTILDEALES